LRAKNQKARSAEANRAHKASELRASEVKRLFEPGIGS
jgi:hypothetical protein